MIVPPWTRWCHMETSGTGPSTLKTPSNEFSVVNIEPEEGQSSRQSVKRNHSTPEGKEGEETQVQLDLSSIPQFDFMGSEMLPICPRWPLLFFNWKGQRVLTTYQNSYLGNISFPVASALSLSPPPSQIKELSLR